MDRRRFLLDLSVCSLALANLPAARRVAWRPRFADDPFSLGIASGDPEPDGVVLWTRLAPEPIAPDGFGGMGDDNVAVSWEVANDEAFTTIVRRGTALATRALAYSVHVEVDGLSPARWYWYRFRTGDVMSPLGRTRTTPARDAAAQSLQFAFVSCQNYEQGLYTAFDHLAAERLDLVAHLGDYIYEGAGADGRVRKHDGGEINTLAEYRRRYAQYKSDMSLQRAHAQCPWVMTWDDHEVDNNYAGEIAQDAQARDAFLARRAAAYQAWYEHQPVRVPRPRSWADLAIHRSVSWGALARFWVLDTRQFRSNQACGDGRKAFCAESLEASRTVLGEPQETWLNNGLSASRASWQVLAQQIMVAPYVTIGADGARVSMDQWAGYPTAQRRLVESLHQRAPGRGVVLTGDIHSSWVNDLRVDFSRPESAAVAAEFVGTSMTSGGNGNDGFAGLAAESMRVNNPHIAWHNARRGYVLCAVTPREWRSTYRTVEYVDTPGAPIKTAAAFVVEAGRTGVRQV